MHDMWEKCIALLTNITELQRIAKYYEAAGLPGCCRSMNVVHVKWSSCATGNCNRAKGKMGYFSLAFQCITNFNCRVLAIYGPQFGMRNDKEIIKDDPNVHYIWAGWYNDICWRYHTPIGRVKQDQGLYLICDNGYRFWSMFICPYGSIEISSLKGYFLANLKSVQKDVESNFGTLK